MKATTQKTITGTEIRTRSNNSNRTYTIWINGTKYRTTKMDKVEFNSCENNTGNDWYHFMKSNDYYKVK